MFEIIWIIYGLVNIALITLFRKPENMEILKCRLIKNIKDEKVDEQSKTRKIAWAEKLTLNRLMFIYNLVILILSSIVLSLVVLYS